MFHDSPGLAFLSVGAPRGLGFELNQSSIDHIVVTAPSLERGSEWVRGALGISPQAGGEHPLMGTHNLLLRLGDSVYLEVISPNPAGPVPARPRWFDLDRQHSDSPPRLTTWVARTADIQRMVRAASEAVGEIQAMRRGSLEWLITIPADGSMVLEGAAPSLIQWSEEVHPASSLPELGCSFLGLEIFHPDPRRVMSILESIGLTSGLTVKSLAPGKRGYLEAHIATPNGLCVLSGRR
jgi:hypothetical protein